MSKEFAYKKNPKIIVLFDIDGTLTPARKVSALLNKTISEEMRATLVELRKKVVVGFVGGSDLAKQMEQIGDDGKSKFDEVLNLFDFSFAENGLTAYKLGNKLESAVFQYLQRALSSTWARIAIRSWRILYCVTLQILTFQSKGGLLSNTEMV
jgi:hypothetical protein